MVEQLILNHINKCVIMKRMLQQSRTIPLHTNRGHYYQNQTQLFISSLFPGSELEKHRVFIVTSAMSCQLSLCSSVLSCANSDCFVFLIRVWLVFWSMPVCLTFFFACLMSTVLDSVWLNLCTWIVMPLPRDIRYDRHFFPNQKPTHINWSNQTK